METCYRHPSRETGVSCSSCGRPICTDCMTPTPVGMRCPECARQKTKVRTAAQIYGGEPRATYVLIALNVLAFVGQFVSGAGGGSQARSGFVYSEGYLRGLDVADGELWRLVSSAFLHADPIHLLLNMVGVYFLGQILEPALGTLKFVALYVASLLAGSFGALLLSEPFAQTVGASGAVFGLLGAAFLLSGARGNEQLRRMLGIVLVFNLLFSLRPGISIGGHLGGLAGGMLVAWLFTLAERRRSTALALAASALVGALAVVGALSAAGTTG